MIRLLGLRRTAPLSLGLVLAFAACETVPPAGPDDTGSDPDPVQNIDLMQPLGVGEFEQTLASSSQSSTEPGVRVRVRLDDGSLIADKVTVEPAGSQHPEHVRGRITELLADNAGGVLTLDVAQLEVEFDGAGTVFLSNDGEEIDMQEFLDRVGLALADGDHPEIKAERDPPASPQPPGESGFTATLIRMGVGDDGPEIALNVDRDNFERNAAPPPDGWLTVLGLQIELRITDGITDIEIERPDLEKVAFEGVVESVDLERGSFTLVDGTVIRLASRTETDAELEHDRHRLRALAAVKEAIDAGLVVVAHGRGAVVGTEPLTLVAFVVAFELDASTLHEFEGIVESVDLDAHSFTLDDGTVVRVLGLTHYHYGWDLEHVLRSLERVAEAIEAGHTVSAHGVGAAVDGDPTSLIAIKVAFKAEPPPLREFDGVIASVDVEHSTFTLDDGTVVHLPGYDWAMATESDGVSDRPWRLGAIAEAVEAGVTVIAKGVGLVKGTNPLTLLALRLQFEVERPGPEAFDGVVESVDLDRRSFTLVGGLEIKVLRITEMHVVSSSNVAASSGYPVPVDPLTLVARAVSSGLAVHAEGSGVVDPTDALRIVALEVEFEIERPAEVQFEGVVEAVDLADRTFTLTDGTVVRWGPLFVPLPPIPQTNESGARHPDPLKAVAEALDAGLTVLAKGVGVRLDPGSTIITALRVEFELDDAGAESFEGEVASFDLTTRTFTLVDGTVVRVVHMTDVELVPVEAVVSDPLASLGTAAAAARNGISIHAKGRGIRVSDNPTTLVAIEVRFEVGQVR